MMEKLYYLQDKRTIVGNSVSWWAIDGKGYTCDIRCAQLWTEEELKLNRYWPSENKGTDAHAKYKPWPVDEVNRIIQHHIDHQDLERKDGIQLVPHTIATHRKDLVY